MASRPLNSLLTLVYAKFKHRLHRHKFQMPAMVKSSERQRTWKLKDVTTKHRSIEDFTPWRVFLSRSSVRVIFR